MTFHRLRNTWATIILGSITAVLLASCGGGGGATTTQGGTLQIAPAAATVYGGVPFTLQLSGGKTPYRLSSTEPALLGLPTSTNANSLTVLPANPGVIDAGLQPNELQVRTVTVTMVDQTGQSATSVLKVAQNFLTGYGISFSSTSCTSGTTTTTTALICAGGDTVLRMAAVTNGNLYGAREFRFDVVQGNYTLVNPDTGASGQSIGVTSDHAGGLTAIVRVAANAPTQVGVIRVTDVATQTSTLETFTITGAATNGALSIIPSQFTFVGATSASCGTGTGDFLVFDGVPPFTAISTDPNIQVTPVDANHTPGRFRITAGNSAVCSSGAQIVVLDSANNRGTVTVTTQAGTVAPVIPPQPLSVQPNSITLGCGQTGSVTVVGGGSGSSSGSGSGSGGSGGGSTVAYSVSSTSPNIGATVTGNTVSITRAGPAGPGTGSSNTIVNVTDGSTVVPITVTSPTTCP